jgi:VWFA-related protein
LIDASGNITQRKNLQINREVAGEIVKSIHDEDQVAIVTYGEKVTLLCSWTSDKKKLKEALLSDFRPGLRSNLSEGILYSAEKIMSQVSGRRRLILLTDGIDSFVPKWTEDAVVALQQSRTSLYIVSPNAAIMSELKGKAYYPGDWYDRIDPKVRHSTNELRDYYHQLETAADTLKDLTRQLDGAMWNPETWDEIAGIADKIKAEFKTEYLIAYRAERRPDNQEFLPIQVIPTRQDIEIRVQRGIYTNPKN